MRRPTIRRHLHLTGHLDICVELSATSRLVVRGEDDEISQFP